MPRASQERLHVHCRRRVIARPAKGGQGRALRLGPGFHRLRADVVKRHALRQKDGVLVNKSATALRDAVAKKYPSAKPAPPPAPAPAKEPDPGASNDAPAQAS